MSENIGITWAPNLLQPRHTAAHEVPKDGIDFNPRDHPSPDSSGKPGASHNHVDNSQSLRGALATHRLPESVDDMALHESGAAPTAALHSPVVGPCKPQQFLPSSTQTSSHSLKAMSERGLDRVAGSGSSLVSRALSTRSSHGQIRTRRSSHSKSLSHSASTSKRSLNSEGLTYPDQSFAALQTQFPSARPHPPLRTRSSHPAQNLLYNEMSTWVKRPWDHQHPAPGARTADSTPVSSPGLFSAQGRVTSSSSLNELGAQLHHLQAPKETHTVEIEHDTYSGNKFINHYEIVQELGRGEHGKVKLGRNIETAAMVAIKIVPRYSVKRRLGRLGAPEDRTKREVAILKKARHPNVVSLLEVIDDPSKNKVYLILEYVEKGEIKWRKPGVREVLAVNNTRYAQERAGVRVPLEPVERDLFHVGQAQRRHMQRERNEGANVESIPNWSLEHGGEDLEDEGDFSDISRSASRHFYESSNPSRTNSHDDYSESALAGSMYGAYTQDVYRSRKFSIAASAVSHMSSEWNFDDTDDEHSYVPAMTLEEARRAIRDTLSGLQFLHFIGIIHRDIKPANLLVASNGMVKISDFGVSYLGRPTSDEDPENKLTEKDASALDDEKELARSVGTPAFWAPELCYEDPAMFEDKEAPKITGALDLWALGITLYCMVYARLPFYATEDMGLHESVCKSEVFLPKTRLVPVDTSRDRPTPHVPSSINCNKRLDYELKFEHVPDGVRDLIRQLLIKDPSKRMTIEEAKKHEWVVEGMRDASQWIKGPPELETKRKEKILAVDEKEMSHAVVRRNIIERALTSAGRLAGSLLGRSNTRKRAPSATTSMSHSSESLVSPSLSNASTVGKVDRDKARDARRSSLRGDEVVAALKTSRENTDHPLAQSQTASPDVSHLQGYFESSNMPKAASMGTSPAVDREGRPRAPDRAVSTAESVKTIKASHMQRLPLHLAAPPQQNDRSLSHDRVSKSKVDALWEGTTRALSRLRSHDDRADEDDQSTFRSRQSSEGDAHADPSLAVSTLYAAGAIAPPDALRGEFSPIDHNTAPPGPSATPSSHVKAVHPAPASTKAAFEHAQEVNQRRLIQEAHYQAEADAEAAAEAALRLRSPSVDECPPSPDDITFLEKQRGKISTEPSPFSIGSNALQAGPSASTIASSVDGYGASSVSQSMSNPSFGIVSSASSPPGENFLATDYAPTPTDTAAAAKEPEPEFMRTADTITKHGRPTQVASGAALEDWETGAAYHGHDEDEDSDEEGMMMGVSGKRF